MGNKFASCTKSNDPQQTKTIMRRSSLFNCKNDREVSLEDFEILKVIGQGTFGKVFLVKEKLTQ